MFDASIGLSTLPYLSQLIAEQVLRFAGLPSSLRFFRCSFDFTQLASQALLYLSSTRDMLSKFSSRSSTCAQAVYRIRAQAPIAEVRPQPDRAAQLWQTPQAISQKQSRWSSSAYHSQDRFRLQIFGNSSSRSPRLTTLVGRRPFSSGPRFNYQQNQYNYNRFGGGRGGRQSIFFSLLQRARPVHFVGLGLGISGIYLYNTETIEVSSRSALLDLETKYFTKNEI